jgi:hypothetical protein
VARHIVPWFVAAVDAGYKERLRAQVVVEDRALVGRRSGAHGLEFRGELAENRAFAWNLAGLRRLNGVALPSPCDSRL